MDPLRALQENMRFLCEDSRMLSGICVAYGTKDAHETARFGASSELLLGPGGFIPDRRRLAEKSLFDLASLTKLFTAVLTMMLVERGRLRLDECVGRIDPRFAHLRAVSVFDVLSFRVSLETSGRIDDAPTREEALRRLFGVRPAPTPAIRVYSDINAMVVKYVVEAKSGMAFSDAVYEWILRPSGMENTYAAVPESERPRCVCYNYEHRIMRSRWILRADTPRGVPHDPKALRLSMGGRDLCGHAGLFSTCGDMVRFASALLSGELIRPDTLREIGRNRTGMPHGDGTYRQYLGFLCFSKHPCQRLSEVPEWMGESSVGLSGFTGNHLSIDPEQGRFVLFLGNRCHGKVSHILPPQGKTLVDYGLLEDGSGLVLWPDGRRVPSSARYVYWKDARLHAPIAGRMRELGWL
ncbi:MAG: serine hydrolase domain-containing protein [Clostridia bacterium]|nr:serine hydrolase domain-containing protein [Clostridia bacterium]